MPTNHDMPEAWQAQAARNRSPEIAAAIAARSRQQRVTTAQASATGAPHPPASALDELSRRRVARFAALEARRLTTGPPRPPQPPVAS